MILLIFSGKTSHPITGSALPIYSQIVPKLQLCKSMVAETAAQYMFTESYSIEFCTALKCSHCTDKVLLTSWQQGSVLLASLSLMDMDSFMYFLIPFLLVHLHPLPKKKKNISALMWETLSYMQDYWTFHCKKPPYF